MGQDPDGEFGTKELAGGNREQDRRLVGTQVGFSEFYRPRGQYCSASMGALLYRQQYFWPFSLVVMPSQKIVLATVDTTMYF